MGLQARFAKGGDKDGITSNIFGEAKYFSQKDDTSKDKDMQAYVEQTWEPAKFMSPNPSDKSRTAKKSLTAQAGNVVPFFPKDWKKNANDVFNLIMNG